MKKQTNTVSKNNKKSKLEFSKVFAAVIAVVLFAYGIYAGLGFYSQVQLYYSTVQEAILAGTEYVNISQPDPSLAITCVTCILASFLTYCLYQFGLKASLNSNQLQVGLDGAIRSIMNNGESEDDSKLKDAAG